jgi:hypothetical protein
MKANHPTRSAPTAPVKDKQAGAGSRKIGSYAFTLLLVVGVIAFIVYRGRTAGANPPGSRLSVGSDNVYYSGSATREAAKALGEKLKEIGFFTNRGVNAILWRGASGAVVSFVCKTGIWDSRDVVLQYEDLGRRIAPSVGGFPMTVRMLDNHGKARRDIGVGLFVVGTNDLIYYFGKATATDARAFSELLKANQFFVNSGATALVSREEGLTISYVANEKAWTQPQYSAVFQLVTRQAALAMGGLPVTLRFLNQSMKTQKELLIQ